MPTINKEALSQLAESSAKELQEVKGRWKVKRKTRLVRFSLKSHTLIKRLAKERKTTMSKTLDYVIKKYLNNKEYYEVD